MESKLKITSGTGICSCLSVRLHDSARYYEKNGCYPKNIDSSSQFSIYKENDQDISDLLFGDYSPEGIPYLNFDHGWQYGWYDQIRIEELSKMALGLCPPNRAIGDKCYNYINLIGDRTCVLYRGNDKVKEIPSTPYEKMFEMAKDTGSDKFFIQTDEFEFFEKFKNEFPDSIRTYELQMIRANPNSYYIPKKNKADFVIKFIAMMRAFGHSKKLVTTTGNTALWAMLYRGHHNNVWQYNGNHKEWRKL